MIVIICLYFCPTQSEQLYGEGVKSVDSSCEQTEDPLNILFVMDHFPRSSQTFVLNLITGLIDRGHNVYIFSFNKGDREYLHPNIKKYNLLDRVIYTNFPKHLSNIDIVFCQFGYIGKKIFEIKKLASWLKKRKVVTCFRGNDISAYIHKNIHIYQKLFAKGNLFLPVCSYFTKRLIEFGCPAEKIIVQHSPIDCSRFIFKERQMPLADTIHLISVCRLVKKKGIDYAIKAVAQLIEKYPNVHFTIVGDGPERHELTVLINQLGLHDTVTLHGWGTQEEVIALLGRSHIFLLPSRTGPDGNEEGIANALKEAMAMGLISVGTWHAGTPELIDHGISGFLVDEKKVSPLTHMIEYIIEHPEQWESIALAAREKIENEFEIKKSIIDLEKLFYALIKR